MTIEAKLARIERRLRPGGESRMRPPIVIGLGGRPPTEAEAAELGPPETWRTCQEQLHRQEEANAEHLKHHPGNVGRPIFIDLDVDEEHRSKGSRCRQNPTK